MTASRMHVRLATASDMAAIVALERTTDSAPHWPEATYEAIAAQQTEGPQRCLFVADTDGAVAGFSVGLIHPAPATDRGDRVAELESVVVAASARRAGTGRALCCAVFESCKSQRATEVVLEVRATSTGAIALYAGLGFTETGRRPRYYRNPDDDASAPMMRLKLKMDPAPTEATEMRGATFPQGPDRCCGQKVAMPSVTATGFATS